MTTARWKAEGVIEITMAEPMQVIDIRKRWLQRAEVKLLIPGITDSDGVWLKIGEKITLAFPMRFSSK
jgi:hypothetical protein